MILELETHDFRNLHDLRWRPAAGVHLLLGGTGAGKTSVLEAIYVVATTRSFRTAQLSDCLTLAERRPCGAGPAQEVREARHARALSAAAEDPVAFRVKAEVGGPRRVGLEVGWSAGEGAFRALNGKSSSLVEHLEPLPVLAWSAAQAEVLTGAPELRRRLIDRGVLARRPAALSTISRYRRVLQHKRRLLLERQAGLDAWNEALVRAAVELVELRRRWVADLKGALERRLEVAALPYPAIELVYQPSPPELEDGWERALEVVDRCSGRELSEGRALLGPHRDRLHVLWGGRELARVASAGERKSLGLLLLAAQGEVLRAAERAPVYLLDDADAELDRPTLEALWPTLGEAPQTLVTSNRPEVWEGLDEACRWRLREGVLEIAQAASK